MRIALILIGITALTVGCADLGSPPAIPVPELTVIGDTTSEGQLAECEFELSFEAPRPVTIIYTLEGLTATAGQDFTSGTDTVVIESSNGSGHAENHLHIGVALLQDSQIEPIEMFSIKILSATNATVTASEATCAILDDDGMPYLSIGDATVLEGQPTQFEVTLNAVGVLPVIFSYTAISGTAQATSDFEVTAGTDTIPAGATSIIIEVNTIDDVLFDQNESFSLRLNNFQNVTVLDSVATATILDNDLPPIPSFATEIQPVLAARCGFSVCHGGSGSQGGLALGQFTYGEVRNGSGAHGPIIISGNGAASSLYFKLTTSPQYGSRMPEGGPFLSSSDIQKIKDWIDAGAPDN